MTDNRARASTSTSDLVPLAERMNYLQVLRVGLASIVLLSTVLAQDVVGADLSNVFLATAGYVTVAAAFEGLRRAGGIRGLFLVGGSLLFDGVYLAWVLYATGGTQSPLTFLLYLHLIGVTLLASYRTGLKIALWHSLLFFVVFYAQAAEILVPTETPGILAPDSPEFARVSLFNIGALWLVAIAAATFSSLNERELRRQRGHLQELAVMAGRLETKVDQDEVAETLLHGITGSFGFDRGVVVGGPDEGAPLLAFQGPSQQEDGGRGVDPTMERAWSSHKTLLLRKLDDNDKRLSLLLPLAKNVVALPLFADGEAVGALFLEQPARRGASINRRALEMVEQFAAHGAVALRKAALYRTVRHQAETDGLTGLANRRSFEEMLERELARSGRTGEPVTLMLLDVDHFKRFNDTYGHQAGDDVLRSVGANLKESSREFDLPARYGGEEFAVILPTCSAKESLIVGERLRNSLSEVEADAPVTASAGVATFPTHAGDASGLIEAADEALYESKRTGRDRITRSRRSAKQGRPMTEAEEHLSVDLPPKDVGR